MKIKKSQQRSFFQHFLQRLMFWRKPKKSNAPTINTSKTVSIPPIAAVSASILVFIGYTEKAGDDDPTSFLNIPKNHQQD